MGEINLAEKYSKNIDKAFAHKSYTKSGAKAKYNFIGVKTVKVYSIDPMKMNDYNRNGMNRFGTVEDIADKIDVGIEILPTKKLCAQMSSGPSYYERELQHILRQGRGNPAVPLVLIGIEQD